MIHIYKITFEDGFEYVGQTAYPLEDRIRRHIQNPDNAELARRLTDNHPYTATVLHSGITEASEAYRRERQEIRKLTRPININGVDRTHAVPFGHTLLATNSRRKPKKNVYPPREGNYICSKCKELKPHTEYPRDRTRFNGLYSRCKPCTNKIAKQNRAYHTKQNRSRTLKKKRCVKCSETKPVSQFHAANGKAGGFYSYCKPCANRYRREHYHKRRNKQ